MINRLLVVAGLLAVCGGCASSMNQSANVEQHAAKSGQFPSGRFAYTYYPRVGAYYSSDRAMWFWIEDDAWRFGSALPDSMRNGCGDGVQVSLECEHPADCHAAVATAFPAPAESGQASADQH